LNFVGLGVTVALAFLKIDKNNSPMSDKPTDKLTSPDILGSTSDLNPTPTATVPTISLSSQSTAAILHTAEGNITIKFNTGSAPNTIANFIKLAQNNFYNGTIFHRVIKGFMIQGGDPKGDGTGGPGYTFADEPFEGEYTRGTVAMANAGLNTNGSQFFIMHQDNPLPKNYVIFGKVISGMETVDKIAESSTIPDGEGSKPVNPVSIKTIELISGEGVN
jgi:cyclophilin family peptidyl-prolyl cis-trans isomerase